MQSRPQQRMKARIDLTREQILAFRQSVNGLGERLDPTPASLRGAAWAGLQDSMPRAAVFSIHARLHATAADSWEDRTLVQLWGPRFSAYVVAARDLAVFSLGRLPSDRAARRRAEDLADRLDEYLDGRTMRYGDAGAGLGEPPNRLRYAATTGRVLIRWDGARQPTVWTVPPPDADPVDAQRELARRYLHLFAPGTASGFALWAGIGQADGRAAFASLAGSLAPVRTPVAEGWVLTRDEPMLRTQVGLPTSARLLPSGDAFFLLWGAERDLLVPDPDRRLELWTSRVWPGAVLLAGEIVGTWRRAQEEVVIASWRRLSSVERQAVESEAAALPLPGISRVRVRWD